MTVKSKPSAWADPDDAPAWRAKDIESAQWQVGTRKVSAVQGLALLRTAARRGRPMGSTKEGSKQAVTIRYSPEVLAAFRADGPGWQTRMDDALLEWVHTHRQA